MPRILEKLPAGGFNALELCRVYDIPDGAAMPPGAVEVAADAPLIDWTPINFTPYAPAAPPVPRPTGLAGGN